MIIKVILKFLGITFLIINNINYFYIMALSAQIPVTGGTPINIINPSLVWRI